MNTIHQKLNLLKDIHSQFNSTLASIQTVKDNCQTFLHHIQYQLHHRKIQKAKMITKLGLKLRQQLLEGYESLTKEVNQIYGKYESLYLNLFQQCQTASETIEQIDPLYRQMLELSKFTYERIDKTIKLNQRIKSQEYKLMSNRQNREILMNKDFEFVWRQQRKKKKLMVQCMNYDEGGRDDRVNLMTMQRLENQRLIELGKNIQDRQIEGIDRVIDNCLGQITKVNIFANAAQQSKSISHSSSMFPKSPISHPKPQPNSNSNSNCNKQNEHLYIHSNQHSSKPFSLQLQSQKTSFVDLTCYQQIQNSLNRHNLHKIMQKQQQYQSIESDESRGYFVKVDLCQYGNDNAKQ